MRSFSLLAGVLVALLSMGLAPAPTADGAALDEVRRLVVCGHYRQAVSLAEERLAGADGRAVADLHLELGRAWQGCEDVARAAAHLDTALTLRRAEVPASGLRIAEVLEAQGAIARGQDDPTTAEALAREALTRRRAEAAADDDPALAPAYLALSLALQDQSEFDAAEPPFLAALRGYEAAGDSLGVAGVLMSALYVSQARGLVWVEDQTRRALRIWRNELGPENEPVASALTNLGNVEHSRGDHAAAVELYRESAAIRRQVLGQDHALTLLTRSNLAQSLMMAGRLEESEGLYRQLIAIQDAKFGLEYLQTAYCRGGLAFNLYRQGRLEEAEEQLNRAIATRRRVHGDVDSLVANWLQYRVVIDLARGEFARAEATLHDLLSVFEILYGRLRGPARWAHQHLALVAWQRDDLETALEHARVAVALHERRRMTDSRAHVRLRYPTAYHEVLAAILLDAGRFEEAWAVAERIRGLALAELLLGQERRDLTADELVEERTLGQALDDADAALIAAHAAKPGAEADPAARDAVVTARQALIAAESSWDAFHVRMAARYPVSEGCTYPLARVQSGLDETTAIVGWLDASTRVRTVAWAYVVRHDGEVRWERLAGADAEGAPEVLATYRDLLQAPSRSALGIVGERAALDDAARELWRARFEPLERHLQGIDSVIVIPTQWLAGIPVEALADGQDRYLGDRFAISYAPSATVLTWLRERRERGTSGLATALLVGDPPFHAEHLAATDSAPEVGAALAFMGGIDAGVLRGVLDGHAESRAALPRLPWSRREVVDLAPLFAGSQVLLGSDASEDEIAGLVATGELARFDVIHIATHAIVDPEFPERSALVFAQTPRPGAPPDRAGLDGMVTAAEILRGWSLHAELVTLSACQTALGRPDPQGTVGLGNALLQAGARCLLVSHWNVDDEATALLMRRFYTEWLDGPDRAAPVSKAEALRRARIWLRDRLGVGRYGHPYYWSSFALVGDGG